MLRLAVVSVLLAVPICCYNFWPVYSSRPPNPYGGNAPCGYGCCYCPQSPPQTGAHPKVEKAQQAQTVCNQTEWVCPKAPRLRRDNEPVPPPAGTYLTFCDYDEQCPDIDAKPHKCCYDTQTNSKICKPAIKRYL